MYQELVPVNGVYEHDQVNELVQVNDLEYMNMNRSIFFHCGIWKSNGGFSGFMESVVI